MAAVELLLMMTTTEDSFEESEHSRKADASEEWKHSKKQAVQDAVHKNMVAAVVAVEDTDGLEEVGIHPVVAFAAAVRGIRVHVRLDLMEARKEPRLEGVSFLECGRVGLLVGARQVPADREACDHALQRSADDPLCCQEKVRGGT